MTRGAQAHLERKLKEKEIEANKEINKAKLEDNEKQRQFEKKENRKNRFANLATSFIKGIKLPVGKNDPEYYKKFISQLDRFVNIPTYQRLGSESFATTKITHSDSSTSNLTVPGVMVFYHLPTIGPEPSTTTAAYPVNQSLNRDKEQILKLNSRSSVNYEGADIGLNLFCTAEIVSMLCEIRRALVIYQTYKGDNAYLAQHYLSALKFNYSDLDANIATYRKRFTVAVKKFNSSIVAPVDVTLYARKIYLASNIFKDRDGDVKQVYMFKQAHFHSLNAVGDGTQIFDAEVGGSYTLNQYFTWLDNMMESITANPDYVEMYADMRHAIPNLLSLDSEINPDEVIQFNDNYLNREQIHNIRMLPWFGAVQNSGKTELDTNDWLLHIDTNGYLYQGSSVSVRRRARRSLQTGDNSTIMNNWEFMLMYLYMNRTDSRKLCLYDMDKDIIDGNDVLDITRFNIGSRVIGDYSTYIGMDITDCGTEVVWYSTIYTMNTAGNGSYQIWSSDTLTCKSNGIPFDNTFSGRFIYAATKFDWAPHIWYYECRADVAISTTPADSVQAWTHCGDLNHTFAISFEDLASINEACVLSEFYLSGTTFKS